VIPVRLVEPLSERIADTRHLREADCRTGGGWVSLPDTLSRKYPTAGRELAWQWLFPATRTYVDPGTGQRRRITCTSRSFNVLSRLP
jgi:hypothetical protein